MLFLVSRQMLGYFLWLLEYSECFLGGYQAVLDSC